MVRATPRRVGAVVAAVVLVITVVLAWLTEEVDDRADQRLLERQVAQAGAVLTTQVAVLTTQLADAGQVATATSANPGAFQRFAAARVSGTPGLSLSLWRVGDGGAERLAVQGPDPVLAAGSPQAGFLTRVPPTGELTVGGIVRGDRDVLGYALRPKGDTAGLVVYVETPLPADRRIRVAESGPFGGLEFAIYLGRATTADRLIGATGPVPIGGDTATTTVGLGDDVLTVVGAAPTALTGGLSAALPWIVLGVGAALAVVSGVVAATMSRRRALAERLAEENERLYHQQRGIAGTLQHALLPDLPRLDGIEAAARYAAGVDELEVGGDWYDVLPRGPGCCVFVVGDISGRGLPAATTMAELRFAARAYLAEDDDIEDVAAKLRRLVHVETDHQFATVLFGELDARGRRLRLISAGHFAPLLVSDGRAELLEVPVAPPVGVEAAGPSTATTVQLPAAATLLAFTDGLVERRGEVVDTGLDRLRTAGSSIGGRPLEAALDEVIGALAADGGRDDTVLLGLRWTT
jgi:serine phosphatase RsbU (regulator of sigma subunit)